MKKTLFHILIGCWCIAFAGSLWPSGLYFDPDRNGEGMLILEDKVDIVGYVFTYGGIECNNIRPPVVSPAPPEPEDPCTLNAQRWFFFADPLIEGGANGILYGTTGINYPEGEFSETNPFGVEVGKAYEVGEYFLREWGDGYQLVVVPTDGKLDDPLYRRVFQFTTKLFP